MGNVFTLEEAIAQCEQLHQDGKTIVFSNGHFDLFHVGHLDYLEKASALGDALFVGVNNDDSTRKLKGPGRPILPATERARLLAALSCIAGVIVFPGDTATDLILQLKPNIYVKGGDYENKPLPERPIVEQIGGRVELITFLPNYSTTSIIERVKAIPEAK